MWPKDVENSKVGWKMGKQNNSSLKSSLIIFFTFLMPTIFLIVGIIVYYITIPNICGKLISFDVWLFTDSKEILDILQKQDTLPPQIGSVIGIRVFWWVWLAGFITSLFFVGRWLQAKPIPSASNAVLTKREPYLMMQNVSNTLKELRQRLSCKELDDLISFVKRLEEKLSVESDFGCGKGAVIDCENNISVQLQVLVHSVTDIEVGDFDKNLRDLSVTVSHINSLLQQRTELKKR